MIYSVFTIEGEYVGTFLQMVEEDVAFVTQEGNIGFIYYEKVKLVQSYMVTHN